MKLMTLGRLAGALLLTAGLAGCMDVTAEMEVLSETAGKSTTTMTIGAEFYPMIKAASAGGEGATADTNFCKEEGDVLTENADGSATCVTVKEGELASLTESDGPSEDATFTVVSPGVVRVAFSTKGMEESLNEGTGGAEDAQAKAMMAAYFAGHNATIRIKGKKIVETNMTAIDGGAEMVIPFTSLFDGTANLPDELFAVVDTN